MTLKRNRSGNDDELTPKPPQNHPANDLKPDSGVQLEQRLPPAQRGAVINQVKVGEFLEFCCVCKKTIPDNVEVYMYRDFSFCSLECRAIPIALDDAAAEKAAAAAKKAASAQEEKVVWE